MRECCALHAPGCAAVWLQRRAQHVAEVWKPSPVSEHSSTCIYDMIFYNARILWSFALNSKLFQLWSVKRCKFGSRLDRKTSVGAGLASQKKMKAWIHRMQLLNKCVRWVCRAGKECVCFILFTYLWKTDALLSLPRLCPESPTSTSAVEICRHFNCVQVNTESHCREVCFFGYFIIVPNRWIPTWPQTQKKSRWARATETRVALAAFSLVPLLGERHVTGAS